MTDKAEEVIASSARAELSRGGIAQAEVARLLGMSQQSVSRRLHGTIPFSAGELMKIANYLGVDISVLYGPAARVAVAS